MSSKATKNLKKFSKRKRASIQGSVMPITKDTEVPSRKNMPIERGKKYDLGGSTMGMEGKREYLKKGENPIKMDNITKSSRKYLTKIKKKK